MEFVDRAYPSASAVDAATSVRPRERFRGVPFRLVWITVFALLFLSFSTGVKADAAVYVDPNGPAGQQYALPVDAIRGETGGDPAAGVPGARSEQAPLFGQGIGPAGAKEKRGNSRKKQQNGKSTNGNPGDEAESPAEERSLDETISGITGDSGSSFPPGMIAVLGGLVLLGIGAGWLGRRAL